MWNMMRSEWYKVLKSRVTWVTLFVFLGMAAIQIVAAVYAKCKGGDWEMILRRDGLSVFSTYPSGTFYFLFVALFVGGVVTSEFTTGTVKQVVSRGVSRAQVVVGQYGALCLAMTVITWIPAMLLMSVYSLAWGFGSVSVARFLLLILGQLVVIWSYVAISMLIGHVTRSGGLSVGINLMILLLGTMAASIASMLLEWDWVREYWLTSLQGKALSLEYGVGVQCKCVLILLALGAACVGGSVLVFQNRDVQ